MKVSALLPAALLLLLLSANLTQETKSIGIKVVVENSILNTPPLTFSAQMVQNGILLGALRRLMGSNNNFRFTYSDNLNYGPYLESVNGLAGSDKELTYWELLVKTPAGETIRPNVGIGCYIPKENEQIILRFTRW